MTMTQQEYALRQEIIAQCLFMNQSGLNQGTSGNISARYEESMIITPSGVPYHKMEPEMLAKMPINHDYGSWEGPMKPSTEWRFHLDILTARSDTHAVVHAHPTYCTAIAIARKDLPAVHYMIAAFGGSVVRCADFARFGTEELSQNALTALKNRTACLLANHGMIAIGETLDKAMWRAVELETLARQYFNTLLMGDAVVLSDEEIAGTIAAFGSYGPKDDA
ncbi:class II aldolase/adducin family protein [Enterovibrio nigricans]|uniref:L-fuculose-phosphate aldolase n=1 Tax=Enterovibrio nigricans DSM 22720 TaxID=1121868 RepID=A0A1T4UCB6_9GAMM|nr:class II aldolase/adducin family protein [Enterovibrio nigricans]SKA50422.1 L-fuculose-phosphate aldolase [Enterovibrio nigricans DSM 22720]